MITVTCSYAHFDRSLCYAPYIKEYKVKLLKAFNSNHFKSFKSSTIQNWPFSKLFLSLSGQLTENIYSQVLFKTFLNPFE